MSAGPTCPFCACAQRVYLESERWMLLRHADPVPIAGWMMLASRAHRAGLDELSAAEQSELGPVMSAISRAVREETGCTRTYVIGFNEAVRHLHLHVVPRHPDDPTTTSWALADRYRATARGETPPAAAAEAERRAVAVAARLHPVLRAFGFEPPAM